MNPAEKNKTKETITEFVMVLLVIMGIGLVLMETVMVSTGNLLASIAGFLKPLNPN